MDFTRTELKNMKYSDFKIKDTLGDGAFGSVWLVKHRENHSLYAMKIIPENNRPETIDNSLPISMKIDHKCLVKVYNYFTQKITPPDENRMLEYLIIIMEYVKGDELFHLVKSNAVINIKKHFLQITQAVAYLHRKFIVHRDIKPENVLVDEFDNVKIIDYDFLGYDTDSSDRVGTPFYAAPEIYTEKYYCNKVDVWSIGILLWFCITGSEPFDAFNKMDLRDKIVDEEPDWSLIKHSDYYDILKKILEKNPSKRINILQLRKLLIEL